MLAIAGCPARQTGVDAANDSRDATITIDVPEPEPDVVRDTGPPPVTRILPPSTRPLSDIVGIASNPGDFPIDANAASTARRAFYFRKIREMGIHRVRRDFRWQAIERVRGTFDYTREDRLLDEADAAGVIVLPSLLYGNVWATTAPGANEFFPPDDPATFANFAAHTAMHFRDRVRAYEVWNEPNAGFRFWRPTLRGDARAYGALLLATTRAIAAVDPTIQVSFGGTVFLPQLITGGLDYARAAFDSNPGLAASLTAYAFHAYNIYVPRVGPELSGPNELPMLDKIAHTAGMIEQQGVTSRAPLWLTEIGWPVTADISEAMQANFTVRAIVLAAFGGVESVYLYTLGDGIKPESFPPEHAFGLVHYDADYGDGVDPEDKAVFRGVRGLMRILGGFHATGRIAIAGHADDSFVIQLTDGTRRAWIVWSLETLTQPVDWQWPADVIAMDAFGIEGTPSTVDASTRTVRLTSEPLYLRER